MFMSAYNRSTIFDYSTLHQEEKIDIDMLFALACLFKNPQAKFRANYGDLDIFLNHFRPNSMPEEKFYTRDAREMFISLAVNILAIDLDRGENVAYDNYDLLLNFADLEEDNPYREALERNLTRDTLTNIFVESYFDLPPTYDFFCKNMTGDFYKNYLLYIENSILRPKNERLWRDQFINPETISFALTKEIKLYFDIDFDTCSEYVGYSDDRFLVINDDIYYSKTMGKRIQRGEIGTKYIIRKVKMKEYSKNILNNFLIEKGFPYEKTYQEYARFFSNTEYYLSFKDIKREKHKYIDMLKFFKLFLPSKIKPYHFYNHTHIIGRSGSGKSEFLKTIIKQVGKSCILIDPHGDIADSLDKKENFFKIAPTESRFVVNPFDISEKSIDNRELVTAEIIQLLEEIIQDTTVSILMKTISFPIISTLLKLPYADFRMFADCINPISGLDYLEKLTPLVDDHLKRLWEDLKTDTYDSTKRSIFNRLQSFLNKHKIINTVCGYDDFADTIKRVEQGENLVISLPIPQLGEEVSEVLGRFFMCRLQIWAKRRQSIAEKDRKPVLLIVDECQNFLSEETASTLDQFGRKFGLYMTLAHQHLAQIDGRGLKGSMLANCKNKIVGYCDEDTANKMGKAMGLSYDDFKDLKKGHWWGLFENQEPKKFYARRAYFKTVSDTVNYAQSQNTDFLDGWQLVQGFNTTADKTNPKFTAKFDF